MAKDRQEFTSAEVQMVLAPRPRELGDGFTVRRALPSSRRRMLGPFIFFDQMGPASLRAGHGLDVRPHPHIGLATITYLFEGALLHRDSLGTVQTILPGEVNWMTAGRGIVHSERSPASERAEGKRLYGFQVWVALPEDAEETAPSFAHYDASVLPVRDEGGARVRLIAGSLDGLCSQVVTHSEMFYAEAALEPGAALRLTARHEERAVYVAEGSVTVGTDAFTPGELLVLRPGVEPEVRASAAARLMLIGGAPLETPRHIWWNFVSSSKARIARAAEDWEAGRFPGVPGETELIPLPSRGPDASVVRYP